MLKTSLSSMSAALRHCRHQKRPMPCRSRGGGRASCNEWPGV